MPRRRHLVGPRHRLRPDRHRSGVRVRLLRDSGVSRPARGGLPGHPRQLQSGDDHDRPGLRRPHVRRAADRAGADGDHRARTSRRRTPDARRTDRSQRRHGAVPRRCHRRRREAGDARRRRRGDRHGRGPWAVQGRDARDRPRRAGLRGRPHRRRGARRAGHDRAAGDRAPGVHPRRARHRHCHDRRRVPPPGGRRAGRQPDQRNPHRAVDRRMEGVRARGDARPRRQLRDHLFDRERRPDGRAHRRLDHRRSRTDAERCRVPGDAQRRLRVHPPRRRRDRRLERAVRPRSCQRPPSDHRDEPTGVAILGARLQGDGIPDRQDRHQAGRRVHARRDRERHHQVDSGLLRTLDRLRGHEGAAVGVREACLARAACWARKCSPSAR